jgi:predicted AlkP superfamily phosphohydrolase/phosphomutase
MVIGLDAATFDVIDPMIEAGELPNLNRVFAGGSRGVLRSTTPPITSQAWATAFTGVNAGRHGLWEFAERTASYRLRLVNGSFRRAPAVWDYLSASGRAAGIVNVPFTWPAQELNGFMLSGFDAAGRERGMTYPESLLGDLRRRFGELELDHKPVTDEHGVVDVDQVRRAAEQKVDAALWLAERFDPDLLVTVFMAIDHAQHCGWLDWQERGLESRLAEVYRIHDAVTGALIQAAGADTDIMIMSDHGGGRLKGTVNLNAWLADEGFLQYAEGFNVRRGEELGRIAVFKLLQGRRYLPRSWRNFVKQRAPWLRDRAHELKEFTLIDWTKTKAFAYGYMGSVVVNVRGREREGTVEPGEEYDRTCDEIATRALQLRDPETGEQLVAAVHRRDMLFSGPELDKVPDLIFEFRNYEWAGKGNLQQRTPTIWDSVAPAGFSLDGGHRAEGIVAFAGPSARLGGTVQASIEDIASTVMYLLGEPIPLDFEGRVIEEGLDPHLLANEPPRYAESAHVQLGEIQTYSPEETAEVEDRLRGLGYVE